MATIPTFSTSNLSIRILSALDHGGHAFVYKVCINEATIPTVLKIFRFTLPPDHTSGRKRTNPIKDEDYQYFTSEVEAYARLGDLADRIVPKCLGFITVDEEFEQTLTERKLLHYDTSRHRRKHQKRLRERGHEGDVEFLPLRALWLEYIPGLRLSITQLNEDKAEDVIQGMEKIHACGVLHYDVKPRNVLVDEESGKVTWIDFSNAITTDDLGVNRASEEMEGEMNEVRKMVGRRKIKEDT